MTENLEYKILRFLKDNENGKYTNIYTDFKYNELFKQKISTLLNFKYISEGRELISKTETKEQYKLLYKIEFKGVEYLNSLEKSITEKKLSESNLKANELNEKISKRNKKETIINIILGIINIGLLIWQIVKSE